MSHFLKIQISAVVMSAVADVDMREVVANPPTLQTPPSGSCASLKGEFKNFMKKKCAVKLNFSIIHRFAEKQEADQAEEDQAQQEE